MTQNIKQILVLWIASLVLLSCESEGVGVGVDSDTQSEVVSLPITITVDDMEYGTEESRSEATSSTRADATDPISSEVKNLWVVLCNGTSDSSTILRAYYLEYGDEGITPATLDFVYTIKTNTVVYLANTSNSELITDAMTLGDIKALSVTGITAPTSTTTPYTTGGTINLIEEEDETYTPYYVMSGSQTLTSGLNSTTVLTASLKRSAVKVTINLQNRWDLSTITGLTLKSVAYTTNYLMSIVSPVFPTDLVAEKMLDFPMQVLSIDGDFFSDEEDVAWTSYDFYIPANMQGTSETTIPTCATYVVVSIEDDGTTYNHTYYLGENLTTDYNLRPNYHYTYNLSFRSVSDDSVAVVEETE